MAAQSNQKARNPNVNMTYSPSGDRALRAIADELRRIGDALQATPQAADEVAGGSQAVDSGEQGPEVQASPQEEALFQSLREWRAGEARKLGMPPYIVATDKVLRAVAQKRPASVEDLRTIPGFGPAKTAKYGAGVVDLVATA
ncbi:MAG: HRDC domain-containing protein [Candidatus Thermoplasmatota archaeon]